MPARCAFITFDLDKNGLSKHRGVLIGRHNREPRLENAILPLDIASAQIPNAIFDPIIDPLCGVFLDHRGVDFSDKACLEAVNLIESIFDIDGFGLLGLTSILDRDYPVVMGVVLLSSFLLLIGNILSDILVALVDPRIRFQ